MKKDIVRGSALAIGAAALVLGAGILVAQPPEKTAAPPPAHGAMADHVMVTPSELKWTDGPPSLPAGAKMAVLEGDPAMAGPFTMRVKMPAGYKIAAHFHPQIE